VVVQSRRGSLKNLLSIDTIWQIPIHLKYKIGSVLQGYCILFRHSKTISKKILRSPVFFQLIADVMILDSKVIKESFTSQQILLA